MKQFKLLLLMAALLISCSVLFGQTLGDVNKDSVVNVIDALIVAQAYVGLTPNPYYPELADVNCSGKVDIVDALIITQYYIGLIDEFCINTSPTPTPPRVTDSPPVGNPFTGAKMYVDPIWSELALNGGGEAIANESTAVILDRIGDVFEGIGLGGHLDNALAQGADLITLVINNLPYKNCFSAYIAELNSPDTAMTFYRDEFIAPIVAILGAPEYSDLKVVCIIEPNTLYNLISSIDNPNCRLAAGSGGYVEGIQYALNQFNSLNNTYCYLDIGCSAWLGWPDSFDLAVSLYSQTIKGTVKGVDSIAGFISNFGLYNPVDEPFLTDPTTLVGGAPLRSSQFYEWNSYFDELDFVQDFRQAMIDEGFPESIGMLIDTGRNGWGGPDRPIAVSTSNNVDTYVNESRIDRRYHRGNWCNQPGGIGYRPQANPAAGVHAYIWGYAPGISDGISDPDFSGLEDNLRHDPMCNPEGSMTWVDLPTGAIEAPHIGRWNQTHFEILLKNAYPPLEETE